MLRLHTFELITLQHTHTHTEYTHLIFTMYANCILKVYNNFFYKVVPSYIVHEICDASTPSNDIIQHIEGRQLVVILQ